MTRDEADEVLRRHRPRGFLAPLDCSAGCDQWPCEAFDTANVAYAQAPRLEPGRAVRR